MNIRAKDWYRLVRLVAIDRFHVMQLFHETCGVKKFTFEDVLREVAEDFEIPYEKLDKVKFARFEDED